jgi:hypothetical protein
VARNPQRELPRGGNPSQTFLGGRTVAKKKAAKKAAKKKTAKKK